MDNKKFKLEVVEWKGETLTKPIVEKPIVDEVMDNKINNFKKSVEENGYNYKKNKLRIDNMIDIMMSKNVNINNLSVSFEKYGEDSLLLVLECDSKTLKVMLAK